MTFVSNHDKNSWDGTEFEQFGAALNAAIVLSVVGDGMPLIYNGQEAGNPKRLAFFEKDPIVWKEHANGELYRTLLALKKRNTALWNGRWGATMIHVPSDHPESVFSFVRQNDKDKVFAVFNFSKNPAKVHFSEALFAGTYTEFASGEQARLAQDTALDMQPWSYRVFVR
jgi:glycosidase